MTPFITYFVDTIFVHRRRDFAYGSHPDETSTETKKYLETLSNQTNYRKNKGINGNSTKIRYCKPRSPDLFMTKFMMKVLGRTRPPCVEEGTTEAYSDTALQENLRSTKRPKKNEGEGNKTVYCEPKQLNFFKKYYYKLMGKNTTECVEREGSTLKITKQSPTTATTTKDLLELEPSTQHKSVTTSEKKLEITNLPQSTIEENAEISSTFEVLTENLTTAKENVKTTDQLNSTTEESNETSITSLAATVMELKPDITTKASIEVELSTRDESVTTNLPTTSETSLEITDLPQSTIEVNPDISSIFGVITEILTAAGDNLKTTDQPNSTTEESNQTSRASMGATISELKPDITTIASLEVEASREDKLVSINLPTTPEKDLEVTSLISSLHSTEDMKKNKVEDQKASLCDSETLDFAKKYYPDVFAKNITECEEQNDNTASILKTIEQTRTTVATTKTSLEVEPPAEDGSVTMNLPTTLEENLETISLSQTRSEAENSETTKVSSLDILMLANDGITEKFTTNEIFEVITEKVTPVEEKLKTVDQSDSATEESNQTSTTSNITVANYKTFICKSPTEDSFMTKLMSIVLGRTRPVCTAEDQRYVCKSSSEHPSVTRVMFKVLGHTRPSCIEEGTTKAYTNPPKQHNRHSTESPTKNEGESNVTLFREPETLNTKQSQATLVTTIASAEVELHDKSVTINVPTTPEENLEATNLPQSTIEDENAEISKVSSEEKSTSIFDVITEKLTTVEENLKITHQSSSTIEESNQISKTSMGIPIVGFKPDIEKRIKRKADRHSETSNVIGANYETFICKSPTEDSFMTKLMMTVLGRTRPTCTAEDRRYTCKSSSEHPSVTKAMFNVLGHTRPPCTEGGTTEAYTNTPKPDILHATESLKTNEGEGNKTLFCQPETLNYMKEHYPDVLAENITECEERNANKATTKPPQIIVATTTPSEVTTEKFTTVKEDLKMTNQPHSRTVSLISQKYTKPKGKIATAASKKVPSAGKIPQYKTSQNNVHMLGVVAKPIRKRDLLADLQHSNIESLEESRISIASSFKELHAGKEIERVQPPQPEEEHQTDRKFNITEELEGNTPVTTTDSDILDTQDVDFVTITEPPKDGLVGDFNLLINQIRQKSRNFGDIIFS